MSGISTALTTSAGLPNASISIAFMAALSADIYMSLARGEEQFLLPCPSAVKGLHLCDAAIHKQFRSRDVAAVVGCEKHHGLRDLIGCAEPAERNAIGNHLRAFLAGF